jgi:hypothetical protein
VRGPGGRGPRRADGRGGVGGRRGAGASGGRAIRPHRRVGQQCRAGPLSAGSRRSRPRRTGGWSRRTCWGTSHGAQAALPRFREQGSGVLINMSSGFGLVGAPYAGAYTATKFAQRGLGQALRGELRGTGVHVCTIMPGAWTPPLPAGRELLGRAAAEGFLASPEKIARAVVRCAERPRPEVVVGGSVRALRVAHAISPRIVERAMARTIRARFLAPGAGGAFPRQPPRAFAPLGRNGRRVQPGGRAPGRPQGETHGRRRGLCARPGHPDLAPAPRG